MAGKSTKNTSSSKQNNSPSSDKKPRSVVKWCLYTALKLLVVILISLIIYGIYLDSKVRNTFEGQRWQIPVQVYGKTPTFNLGEPLNLQELKEYLLLAGYEKVAQPVSAGQFAMSTKRMVIFRHSFDFGDHNLNATILTIDVTDNIITAIYDDIKAINHAELAPILIDRMLPESKEDRVIVKLEQVPEQLIDMLLLVEDRDFYHHMGVSPLAIARAFVANIKAGRTVQGGSTLTQQLVKNMFLSRQKTIWRKFNEALMAFILEYRYSKDQLLEAYLNEVYLGQHYANGIYGFGLAAKFYFGKTIEQLSLSQMATLVGQIKGPSYYDPWRYPERAHQRRDLILSLMFDHLLISKAAYENAVTSPLAIRKNRRIVKHQQPAYLQLVKHELSELLSEQAQESGIKVFTAFDIRAQSLLNKTVKEKLPAIEQQAKQRDLQTAMLVTNHQSGEIIATIGGRDPKYAGFNRALNAKRPIGSLIKPIVYATALEKNEQYSLATPLEDKPLTITADNGELWQPQNYDKEFRQQTNLYQALVHSFNVPTVNLGLAIGLKSVANTLNALGYEEEVYQQPALLLGATSMSPHEINQIYLTLASQGVKKQSHVINKIIAENGEVLWQFSPQTEAILSTQTAYLIQHAMQGVTKEGSAKSLTWRLYGDEVAGKTGTSNDQRDSWFIGYDKQYLVTTWLGRDDNQQTAFTGSSGALVLFADFMQKFGVQNLQTPMPDGVKEIWFNNQTGLAYQSRCANATPYPANVNGMKKLAKCTEKHEKDKNWFERWFGD